jgi:hypothetical protein
LRRKEVGSLRVDAVTPIEATHINPNGSGRASRLRSRGGAYFTEKIAFERPLLSFGRLFWLSCAVVAFSALMVCHCANYQIVDTN